MNAGGLTYSGSVNTRFFKGNYQVALGASPAAAGFTHTFPLDPNNPFYRIFAGNIGDTVNAWTSTFTFSLGGVSCGNPFTAVWGNDAVYNNASMGGFNITPMLGSDILITHSQYAGLCGYIIPNMGDALGFCSRWSALADQVVIVSKPAGAITSVSPTNAEYFHGVIQQPY